MLKKLSDQKLCSRLERLVRHERKVMAVVVEHIAEMEKRKLYLALGYRSLFDYLTKNLGYSESSAYRRMQAARALLLVPEIKSRLEAGSLKLSQITLVQKSLRHEEKIERRRVSLEERKEIFSSVAGKTGAETEKVLDRKLANPWPKMACTEKHRRDDSVELSLSLSGDLYEKLQKVKELYSHVEPGADWIKLIELMADDVIRKRDLLTKKPAPQCFAKKRKGTGKRINRGSKESTGSQRKPIPASVKRLVLQRDRGCCQYVGIDGRKCESRHQVQLDHIHPVYLGGDNKPENLRLLCREHNIFRLHRHLCHLRRKVPPVID